jgi:cysteine-rich repeat protein
VTVGGCKQPTEVVVEISTDANCTDVWNTSITAGRLVEMETRAPATVTQQCNADSGRIGSIVLLPSSDDSEEFAFRLVTGFTKGAQACVNDGYTGGCIVARRALHFLPNQRLDLPVLLEASCIDVPCTESETCRKGHCVSATLPDPTVCTDPAGCDSTASGGSLGSASSGGATSTGGTSSGGATSTGGTSSSGGGFVDTGGSHHVLNEGGVGGAIPQGNVGGDLAEGGALENGGAGGTSAEGGAAESGGSVSAGGTLASGGSVATGGMSSSGGASPDGGTLGTGGLNSSGGDATDGGTAPGGSAGMSGLGGAGGAAASSGGIAGGGVGGASVDHCGDGILDSGEACDDKNAVTGDGCNRCSREAGWLCQGQPSRCVVAWEEQASNGAGDDLAPNALRDLFSAAPYDSSWYLYVEIDSSLTQSTAFCLSRGDWYADNYLLYAGSANGGTLSSGIWAKWWRVNGGAWSIPDITPHFNNFGKTCTSGDSLGFCPENLLGLQQLAILPGNTGIDETYRGGFPLTGATWQLHLVLSPKRQDACGF